MDPERARKALRTTLDAWKKGDSFVTLKDGQPSIVAQDMDWQAGRRLVDYQLLDEGKAEDANLICGVRVTLQDRQGKEVKKTVKYIVGTHPYITVFREIMP